MQRAGRVPAYWTENEKGHGKIWDGKIVKEVLSGAGVGRTQEVMIEWSMCHEARHGVDRFACMDSMCQRAVHRQDWVLWEDEELEYPDEHFWSIHTAALKMIEQLKKAKK